MNIVSKNKIQLKATTEDLAHGRVFIQEQLQRQHISKTIISDARLVFDALFHEITQQGFGKDNYINLSSRTRFGALLIDIGFEGDIFFTDLDGESPSVFSRIMKFYADSIEYSYRSGYNKITIFVRRSWSKSKMMALLSVLLATVAYLLLDSFSSEANTALLYESVIIPLEKVFANAVLMVGAPVTFLSLLNNLSDVYILSERNSDARKLHFRTFASSLIVVVLAILVSFRLAIFYTGNPVALEGYESRSITLVISDLIESFLPSDIFTPFKTLSPFPIIFLAALFTYAFCSSSKYFSIYKKTIQATYYLFSQMLGIVTYTLPFFFFIATLHLFIKYGFQTFNMLLNFIVLALLSLPALMIYYLFRLLAGHVNLKYFFSGLLGFLKENIAINSAIDAVPYNIRYCTRVYKMDRPKLERSMPILAQINLDGNCYFITLVSVLMMLQTSQETKWFEIAVVGLLVFVLSLGAPNQPGTCLIGFITILSYLNTDTLLHVIIISEVMYGSMLNLINVVGDLVTVAIEDNRAKNGDEMGAIYPPMPFR